MVYITTDVGQVTSRIASGRLLAGGVANLLSHNQQI